MAIRHWLTAYVAAQSTAAFAATATYVSIDEKISTSGSFAIAASNGAGPTGGPTKLGSAMTFDELILDTLMDQHLDKDGVPDEVVSADYFVQQRSFLTPFAISSAGTASSTTSVFGGGVARSETLSRLRTTFSLDADTPVSAITLVSCDGTDCLSFVTLSNMAGVLFDNRSAGGDKSLDFSGTLLAGQTYTLEASTHGLSAISSAGNDSDAGAFFVNLAFTDVGGVVPEPAPAAMLLGGILVLAWRQRSGRRRR